MAMQSLAGQPFSLANNASGFGAFSQPYVSPYWTGAGGADFNNSVMSQYFQWPSFSNIHTAHGAPSYNIPFPPYGPSANPNVPEDRSDEQLSEDKKSEEVSGEKRSRERSKHKTREVDKSRSRSRSREKSRGSGGRYKSKSRKKSKKDSSGEKSQSAEVGDDGSSEYYDDQQQDDDFNVVESKRPHKKHVHPVMKVRSEHHIPSSSHGLSSYGGGSSSGGYGASNTHHHYHKGSTYGSGGDKDQSCFCTIGKVGYMEPGYHHSSGGHHKGGKGGVDSETLGFTIGIPVTAGVLALMTGIAAFLVVLALQGVGREGSVVLNELKNRASISRVLEIKPDPAETVSALTSKSPPVRSGGSSAFAPHRDQHRRMKRNLSAQRQHLPVIWYW